jgi:Flp pilus assembly protein TadD
MEQSEISDYERIAEELEQATGLAVKLAANGRLPEAIAILRQVLRVAPESAQALRELGICLFMCRDFGSAAAALVSSLELVPQDVRSRHALALVWLAQGEHGAAKLELKRVLAIDPELVTPHVDLGVLALAGGEHAQALACFDQALTREPQHTRALYYRATALEQAGRAQEAQEQLVRVSELQGKYALRARERARSAQ